MEQASLLLKRIMLLFLLLLLAAALALAVREGLVSPSYLLALAAGALWAYALHRLLRRRPPVPPRHGALLAAALCLALNLAWVLLVRIEPFSDYDVYWQCALALAAGREIPNAWYIAMYPHILGTASALSLLVRLFGASVLAVSVANVLLSTAGCLLLYGIGWDFAGEGAAFLAALLWALCPGKLMLNSLVFSEPLYTCLILLFLRLFLLLSRRMARGADRETPVGALCGIAALGLLLAAINIVRPIALILIIALVLWLVLLRGAEAKSGRLWCLWLAALLAMTALFRMSGALWDRHVEARLGLEPADIPIYNLYVGFNEQTRGQWSAEDMDLLFSLMREEGLSPSGAQRRMLPHLKARLASVEDWPRLLSGKLFAFLGNDELGGYTYRYTRDPDFVRLCMVLCNVFYYGVLLAAAAGLWRMLRSRALGAALVIPLFMLGLTLAHLLVEVSSRYHYALIPLFVLFAAFGLVPQTTTQRSPS